MDTLGVIAKQSGGKPKAPAPAKMSIDQHGRGFAVKATGGPKGESNFVSQNPQDLHTQIAAHFGHAAPKFGGY